MFLGGVGRFRFTASESHETSAVVKWLGCEKQRLTEMRPLINLPSRLELVTVGLADSLQASGIERRGQIWLCGSSGIGTLESSADHIYNQLEAPDRGSGVQP